MRVFIVGNGHQGKSKLIEAIKQNLITIKREDIKDNTKKPIETKNELILENDEIPFSDEILFNKNKHKKKGKEIKDWERTKFYQR